MVQGTRALAKWLSVKISIWAQVKPNDTIMEFTSEVKEQFWYLIFKFHYYYNFIIYILVVTY